MLFAAFLMATLSFAETKTLALQICLDRAGFSCNTIDGVWGPKGKAALAAYRAATDAPAGAGGAAALTPEEACDRYFADRRHLFREETVTAEDLAALVKIPKDPAARAELARMGYESVKEMFAERGHVSQRALERLNPGVDWDHVAAGTRLTLPNFPSLEEDLAAWPRAAGDPRPVASAVYISLGKCQVIAVDERGCTIALFPCSVAKRKAKLPRLGELKVTTTLAHPNYTYTPDHTPKGMKPRRYIWPEGENSPIGVAWIGLNLPGYGIHGTVCPETIGQAESHGCFRLANWNAARLYALVRPGTRVIVLP